MEGEREQNERKYAASFLLFVVVNLSVTSLPCLYEALTTVPLTTVR